LIIKKKIKRSKKVKLRGTIKRKKKALKSNMGFSIANVRIPQRSSSGIIERLQFHPDEDFDDDDDLIFTSTDSDI
jgi:hypothetical protein